MFEKFRQMLRASGYDWSPCLPQGERVYAIGDIHGRLDLLTKISTAIEEDDAARGEADTTIIFLGDLIDRGPDSAGVVKMAREWSQQRKVRILAGNHEEMFLLGFYKTNAFKNFLRMGGRETIVSYDIDHAKFLAANLAEAQQMMIEAVPIADREFVCGFEQTITIGDYLFVHAGINPERPLAEQLPGECRWIREPFLSHADDYGCVVVHGHTVTDEAVIKPNRIGIDTGAFISGKLTAIGLEGEERWLIQAQEDAGTIETFARAA